MICVVLHTFVRFMATTEAPIHDNIKNALVEGDEHGTALIMRSMRNTERVFKNKDVEEVLRIEKEHPGDFSKISHLVSGQGYRKVFQETGEVGTGVWSAGTVGNKTKYFTLCITFSSQGDGADRQCNVLPGAVRLDSCRGRKCHK